MSQASAGEQTRIFRTASSDSAVALVAIGRNEGDRLKRCIRSALQAGCVVIYVDSASTDDSLSYAAEHVHGIVELDVTKPFTAARARNAGARLARDIAPQAHFLQFVDGDCELDPNWIRTAVDFLRAHPKAAVVCGRRRERFPDATVYNHICDIEWNTPIGKAQSCGGDALIRKDAFEAVGGYDPTLIAGEEPEMCCRLRNAGREVWRINHEMTLHDANMTRFGQWWKRSIRSGHAFAEVSARHGRPPEHFWRKNVRSNFVWALLFPLWPVLFAKLVAQKQGIAYAFFTMLSKWPQTWGQLKFYINRLRGRSAALIEYK